ncbi:MAG: kinase-like domain-containing protein [Podila humilis]|nr:MAG: kinase-like domain-containing protein [Podila humilis]
MSPAAPRPLSLPSPSVSPFKSMHSPMPLSPTEHFVPEQENLFSKCRNILLSCEVVIDRSKTGLLGHGRHAEVYKAFVHPPQEYSKIISLQSVTCRDLFETSQGVACAAKCLLSDPQSVEAGRAEDNILKRLQHRPEHHLGRQFVVDYIGLYDTSTNNIEYRPGSDNSKSPPSEAQKCLLLEYCAGGTIWDWIRLHPEQVGLQQWLVWARQLLLAVDYIHEAGLIHHDIKPHNILLTEALDAKLSDFGGGVFLPESQEHPVLGVAEGLGRGTQPYSAPELFASVSSNITYGQGIDIYSLGVSLYVLGLTAQDPFHKMKSMLEMVVWIKKGGFWLWEDQSWVHDRGPVPKDVESRRSTSNLSRSHSLRHVNSGGTVDKSVSRSTSFKALKQGMDVPDVPLAPINTRLAVEERHLSVSGSPDRTFKISQPCTPVSPLPLPSPIIGPLTPRSPGLMDDRRASGETVMRFLNGEVVPSNIVQLLKEMCHPDPQRRPDAKHILKALDEIEMELLSEHSE